MQGCNGGKHLAALRIHLDEPLVMWGWDPGFGRAPVATPRRDFLNAFETWTRNSARRWSRAQPASRL